MRYGVCYEIASRQLTTKSQSIKTSKGEKVQLTTKSQSIKTSKGEKVANISF